MFTYLTGINGEKVTTTVCSILELAGKQRNYYLFLQPRNNTVIFKFLIYKFLIVLVNSLFEIVL